MELSKKKQLEITALKVRRGIVDSIHAAKAGHPGGSLSIADLLTYLYFDKMNIDPANPKMANRDRIVLSKGHAAPALYSVLAHRGFFPVEEVITLRKADSRLQGHPDMKGVPGVDMSSGSLGQGFSVACGMALAAKLKGNGARVYTAVGDGESQEGQIWEAAMFAAHYNLDNLVLIIDWNGLQIDGKITDVMNPTPHDEKLLAFGWNVISVDAHNFDELEAAFKAARECKGKPTAIIAKSHKGNGVSYMTDNAGWHGKAPNAEQYEIAVAELKALRDSL